MSMGLVVVETPGQGAQASASALLCQHLLNKALLAYSLFQEQGFHRPTIFTVWLLWLCMHANNTFRHPKREAWRVSCRMRELAPFCFLPKAASPIIGERRIFVVKPIPKK